MPVAVRLMKIGKKHVPFYRVVAVDKRKKRSGAYIEKIGLYNPLHASDVLQIDEEKLNAWIQKGAVISQGLSKILVSYKRTKKNAKTG